MRVKGLLLTFAVGVGFGACDPGDASMEDRNAVLGCSSNPIYDDQGKYVGCITFVDGHECRHDTKGLTELGCETFCDGYPWPLTEPWVCKDLAEAIEAS